MRSTSGKAKRDVALIGPVKDGKASALRFKDRGDGKVEVEQGAIVPLKDGETPMGDVIALTPDEGHAPFYKVEVVAESPVKSHPGPANVATEAYRKGWERTFRGHKTDLDDSAN